MAEQGVETLLRELHQPPRLGALLKTQLGPSTRHRRRFLIGLKRSWQEDGRARAMITMTRSWTTIGTNCTCSWCYLPDRRMRDWAIREAYLVLKEREAAGVEPVSRDFVDPAKVLAHLPSDEELREAGVVINI